MPSALAPGHGKQQVEIRRVLSVTRFPWPLTTAGPIIFITFRFLLSFTLRWDLVFRVRLTRVWHFGFADFIWWDMGSLAVHAWARGADLLLVSTLATIFVSPFPDLLRFLHNFLIRFLFFSEETLTVSTAFFNIAVAFGKSFRASSLSFWIPRRISLSDTLSSISNNRVLSDSSSFCTKLKFSASESARMLAPSVEPGVASPTPCAGMLSLSRTFALNWVHCYVISPSLFGVAILRISLNEPSVSTMLEPESAVFDSWLSGGEGKMSL